MKEIDRFTCEQVFKRLDDYIDQELTPGEMQMIREHLEICAWCAQTFEFQASVLDALQERIQRIPAPIDLRDRVAGALRRAREEASET
jgi:anti-sigma factor (TIGR02949 family)